MTGPAATPTGAPARIVMESRTIFIDAHAMRRHERASALKECFAAVMLLSAGWNAIDLDGWSWLPVVDLMVGLTVLVIGGAELKRGKKFGSWIRWFDVAVGVLLALEGVTLAAEGKRYVIYLYYATGLAYILVGLFHHHLGRRRYVRLDDDGVQVRMTPFRKFRLLWPDIVRVTGHDDRIEIYVRSGRRYEIPRRVVPNLDEIRDLMLDRASGRGISTR
ncbi:MAG TPA: hypothetical protein VMC86_10555 [Gemmatimonadales bacterium]|nr:hypothetical protein [Gemmatimonadales bacterium]